MNTTPAKGPDFLVIGAAKSGTTSLSYYLRQHPQIFFAREKESHHFLFPDGAPDFRGPRDAEEFVPLIISDRDRYLSCFAGARPAQICGEASVYYMSEPQSLRNAIEYNPDMKFIAVLREPAERSFSAWSHMMRDGREPVDDFLSAFGLEAERRAAHWSPGFFYEAMSRYGEQLAACYDAVPREQIMVVLYEDLVTRQDETMAEIFAFLGLQPVEIASERVMNASGNPRFRALNHLLTQRNPVKAALKRIIPYETGTAIAQRVASWNLRRRDISDDDRRVLTQRFSSDVAQLAQLLGRDLSGWGERHQNRPRPAR
ncbi:MAG: sulfotransferase [Dermatophilaceae bacterium]